MAPLQPSSLVRVCELCMCVFSCVPMGVFMCLCVCVLLPRTALWLCKEGWSQGQLHSCFLQLKIRARLPLVSHSSQNRAFLALVVMPQITDCQ
jgi:hypothetical protein